MGMRRGRSKEHRRRRKRKMSKGKRMIKWRNPKRN